jgi:hypothetical protein
MEDVFQPGDKVPRSGVYRVMHARNHAPRHEVTVVYGRDFPLCNACGRQARFVLLRPARVVDSNPHFHREAQRATTARATRVQNPDSLARSRGHLPRH